MLTRFAIYLLFFFSGISGLAYQIVWMRKLGLVFGSSIFATTVVLICFMSGLALGSYLFGSKLGREKRPLALYALIEALIALTTVVSMFALLPALDWSYSALLEISPNEANADGVVTPNGLVHALRFILVAVLLIVPTTLMGGTLPVITKFFVQKKSQFGIKIALLYGLNTAGAMTGCLLTGLYLIRVLGESMTIGLAAGINLIVAISAYLLDKKISTKPKAQEAEKPKQLSARMRYVLIVFGFAGMTSLAYEVIWFRALYNLIGFHVYTVTVILAAFLFGLTLGSLAIAKFVDSIRSQYIYFSLAQIVIAVLAIFSIPLINTVPDLVYSLVQKQISVESMGDFFVINNFTQFLISFAIFAVPTFVMGTLFPVVNKIYQQEVENAGENVGDVYAVNTLGTIIGSGLAGFVLLPWLKMPGSVVALASLNVILGAIMSYLEPKKKTQRKGLILSGACAVCFFALVGGLGLHNKVPAYLVNDNEPFRLVYYSETNAASLTVKEYERRRNLWGYPDRKLCINNACTAHTTFRDVSVHKVLAHTPTLLHPNPKDALVIGFGLGSTAHSIMQHSKVNVDCVEILKEETETAEFFRRENNDVIGRDERFRLIIEDGRNYLASTKKQYDIVSVNAIAPRFSPTLYTKEFFEMSRERMRDKGVMAIWLPTYSVSKDAYRSIFRSFADVFPSLFLFYVNHSHYLLIGSAKPIDFDLDAIREGLKEPSVAQSLKEVGLDDPLDLLSTIFMTPRGFESWLKDAEANTDQNPIAEFDLEEQPGMPFNPDLMNDSIKHFSSVTRYMSGNTVDFTVLQQKSNQLRRWMSAELDFFLNVDNPSRGMNRMIQALRTGPRNHFLLALLASFGQTEIDRPYFRNFDEKYRDVLLHVLGKNPHFVHAHYYLASILTKLNQVETAYKHRNIIFQARSDDWMYAFSLGLDLLNLNQVEEARKLYTELTGFSVGGEWGHFGLGLMALDDKNQTEARKQFEKALELNPAFVEAKARLASM